MDSEMLGAQSRRSGELTGRRSKENLIDKAKRIKDNW